MIEEPYALLAVILGLVTLSAWLDSRYALAGKVSAVVMILFLTGLLTNRSAFYEGLTGLCVLYAVCLILFTVNLEELRCTGKALLAAFAVVCLGTAIEVLTAGARERCDQ